MLRISRPPLALAALALLVVVVVIVEPTASVAGSSGRCGAAKHGTGASEALKGTAGHDAIKGAGGRDLIKGRKGGDCLRGGGGDDGISGSAGRDRLSGGAGRDRLRGGGGRDRVMARDGQRDLVRCGGSVDLARVDGKDKTRGCERTRRPGGGGSPGGGSPGGGAGYPSLADVDWEGDFDSGCDLVGSTSGAWDNDATNADYAGSETTIERSVVGEGKCAAKFVNGPSSTMTRAELARSETGANPEFAYEVLVRVPSGQTFPEGSNITQTKMEKVDGEDCYNGGWKISDDTGSSGGGLELRTVPACTYPQTKQSFHVGALPRDQWFALKVHEKFSNDPQVGFVHAWMDADGPGPDGYVEVVPKTHVDNVTGHHVRLRIGSYRQPTDHTNVVYMDGFRLDCIFHC
jgi:hypothetical protein